MIDEVFTVFKASIKSDFGIDEQFIKIWFSGNRGLHVEIPAAALGAWPHHELWKVYGYYAKDLKEREGLKFLDLSLYSGKHLYRLENSIHQKSMLYKWPLRMSELPVVKKFDFFKKQAATPRHGVIWPTALEASDKARAAYTKLAMAGLEVKTRATPNTITPGDISKYDRTSFFCIDTLFSEEHLSAHGNRNTTAFVLASHLRQNGFDYDQAQQEMARWASEHCDPPYVSESDTEEWSRALTRVFEGAIPTSGCSFIQQNLPHLCQETKCKIGRARIARRSRTT
jgi:hypothetical protein